MNKELTGTIVKIIGVVAALYLFLVGINGMSSAIKHMGAGVAESILDYKQPRGCSIIGIFSTVLFQSSSTTTSLIVGMVVAALVFGGCSTNGYGRQHRNYGNQYDSIHRPYKPGQ